MPLTVPGIYPLYREQLRRGQSTVLAWNHTISPAAVNEFRFGTTYHRNFYEADVVGTDLLQQFGIVGVPTTGVKTGPNFNINGVTPWNPDTQLEQLPGQSSDHPPVDRQPELDARPPSS